jgi:outer membrane protein TolC
MTRQWLAVMASSLIASSVATASGQTPAAPATQAALQAPTTSSPAPPAPTSPYQAPAMRFDTGLSLLDAVTLTLQHDPTIKLREADVDLQKGLLRTTKGPFDWLLQANGTYSRDQTELLQKEKQDQINTRTQLQTAITQSRTLTDSLKAASKLLADKNAAFNSADSWNLSGIKDKDVLNEMTILQSELVLFRDVLASPSLSDPTVKTDTIDLRQKTLGNVIDTVNAQAASIDVLPDQLQTELNNLGSAPDERWTKQAELTLDLFKMYRTGFQIHPFVDLKYGSENFVGKDQFESDFGGEGSEPFSNGKLGFEVILPLLRGAGRDSVAAAEIAAKYDLEASRLSVLFQKSGSVLSTIQAYWQARAAADQVEVLRHAVEIEGELATITRTLIAANEKPMSDDARVAASTADRRSQYEAAQRQLSEARINLAQAMGVSLADALSIPLASDGYPQPPADLAIDPQTYAAFIGDSLTRRFDRQALQKSQASGKALVEGARIDQRPLLNATASGWGTSTQEHLGYSNWIFRSGSAGLNYQQPFGNNAARGLYEERQASLKQTDINAADLDRVIGLNVVHLSESLRIAAERLRSAEEAVHSYDQTLSAEQVRLKSGDASLIDTILTEQQSTGARLSYITAEQDYATLLAELRHEAGLLVQDGAVDGAQFVTVPPGIVRR